MSEECGRNPWEQRAALQGKGLALRGGGSPTDLTLFGIWELLPSQGVWVFQEKQVMGIGNQTGIPAPARAGGEEWITSSAEDHF